MRVSGARPGLYQVPHETDLVAHESFRSQVIIYVTCDIYMTPTQLKLERERERGKELPWISSARRGVLGPSLVVTHMVGVHKVNMCYLDHFL